MSDCRHALKTCVDHELWEAISAFVRDEQNRIDRARVTAGKRPTHLCRPRSIAVRELIVAGLAAKGYGLNQSE